MDRITENILFVINNPNLVRDKFVKSLDAYGCSYDQAKTVSMYADPYQAAVVGQTTVNFISSSFQYPQSEHFLICAVRAFSGANATLASTAWVAGISDALTLAGSFTLVNNGTVELKAQPYTLFQPASNSPDAGLFILPKPVMWKAQTSLAMAGNWTVAPTTTNQNLRFEFIGIKLI
jgi:hypothetical protein